MLINLMNILVMPSCNNKRKVRYRKLTLKLRMLMPNKSLEGARRKLGRIINKLEGLFLIIISQVMKVKLTLV